MTKRGQLSVWSVLSVAALGGAGLLLSGQLGDRRLLLPGSTSDGHHQMELACESCHGEPFAGPDALQASCVRCHGPELEAAEDSHPRSKFTDPRNATRVARLDARRCVTCHREHWPEGTLALGVSVPIDSCKLCHEDVGRERASHAGVSFESCADVGCHKFHDNRALYEDFLVEHAAAPALSWPPAAAPDRGPSPAAPARPLSLADQDAPAGHGLGERELGAWAASAHARASVNCRGCHEQAGAWRDEVPVATCGRCHADERAGWVSGKHGLRVGLGLEPMRTELARAPMHAAAAGAPLDCSSCHGGHGFDLVRAAAEACLGCHADRHTLAYPESGHARALSAELTGQAPAGSGVSCATCHLPRLDHPSGRQRVQHNQNDNLRPREKMLREVCLDCHGLAFAIDALADEALVAQNFAGAPSGHVPSIDWAAARARAASPEPAAAPENRHDAPPTSPF